ncbi:MAG: RNA polymerase sigma factor [Bacteroidales bacterium]|nr:RNA polymerase sigma factor [Bacteroidales bacterium]MBD5245225.1 RNA polymerase sigma factor [Barnesiella sp.]
MLSKIEELSLIARCIATDNRDAFGQLVVEYEGGLRRFLYNLTGGDASLTDDLAQETFLKAYLSIRSFKGISRFKTWLYRIAYNEFVTYRRKYAPEVAVEEIYAGDEPAHTPVSSNDISMDLQTALSQLPDTERTIVLLFYMEDLPIKKVSQITGCPEGTVKSYLNRARTRLSHLLN